MPIDPTLTSQVVFQVWIFTTSAAVNETLLDDDVTLVSPLDVTEDYYVYKKYQYLQHSIVNDLD